MYSKLDMTLNFIDLEDLEESIDNLAECEDFKELYLTGNPCTSWPNYKEYIMAKVWTINRLDGEDVTKSMRLAAKQKIKVLEAELKQLALENIEKKKHEVHNPESYSKETRVSMYEEMQEQKRA